MDKINLGSTIPAYPMPVSLVGAHVDGQPNFLAVAWFTMASYKPPAPTSFVIVFDKLPLATYVSGVYQINPPKIIELKLYKY